MNIRSIHKILDSAMTLLQEIKNDFEILILRETRQLMDPYSFNIRSYNTQIYNFGSLNQCYGMVVYMKNNVSFVENIISLKNGIKIGYD